MKQSRGVTRLHADNFRVIQAEPAETIQQVLSKFAGTGNRVIIRIAVAVLTRATPRRIAEALAGAAVAGVVVLGIAVFGESAGWWHMAIKWEPYWLTLMWIDFALTGGYLFLITWRFARRFGRRGLDSQRIGNESRLSHPLGEHP